MTKLKETETSLAKKLRGGYYTPAEICEFICRWVIHKPNASVLEPSCGDGAFVEAIIQQLQHVGSDYRNLKFIELNAAEADKVRAKLNNLGIAHEESVCQADFFHSCKALLSNKTYFDCIVGNPPFIRYQDFPEEQKDIAFAIMARAGLKPSRLINTWIPFLVSATLLLKPGGRVGMVIPAELFQVNYAAATRLFLSEAFGKIFLVTFKKLVFQGVQQEIVLFLGEKNGSEAHGITVIETTDISTLKTLALDDYLPEIKRINHSSDKWTQYFLSNKEIGALREVKQDLSIPVSGECIEVDVGVVTGQNKFFLLNQTQVATKRLARYTQKIIGKSNQLKGIYLSKQHFEALADTDAPVFLLCAPNVPYQELSPELQAYLRSGEEQLFHTGYKCRNRKKWWLLPSLWTPDAFMLRQVHHYPKLISNDCEATSTDTLHRVKFKPGIEPKNFIVSFSNSMTFAFSEVLGRSYGGGVLTFEPSEAEKFPVPFTPENDLDFEYVDNLVRQNQIMEVLEYTDNILLKEKLGFSKNQIATFRNIWLKLSARRIARK